jgi:hypothetical protein
LLPQTLMISSKTCIHFQLRRGGAGVGGTLPSGPAGKLWLVQKQSFIWIRDCHGCRNIILHLHEEIAMIGADTLVTLLLKSLPYLLLIFIISWVGELVTQRKELVLVEAGIGQLEPFLWKQQESWQSSCHYQEQPRHDHGHPE